MLIDVFSSLRKNRWDRFVNLLGRLRRGGMLVVVISSELISAGVRLVTSFISYPSLSPQNDIFCEIKGINAIGKAHALY